MFKTVEVPLSGHPDKICDQIVEAILDEYLRRDPKSRVDLQALGSHGMLMVGGTVDSRADFDSGEIVKRVYKDIGYNDEIEPFINIERPSEDMSRNMVNGGAQGTTVVYGYATKETREYLPRTYVYANAIARRIDDLRRTDESFTWMCPDGKVQLTMDGEKPVAVTVLVQHLDKMNLQQIQAQLVDQAIVPILGEHQGMKLYVNCGGAFCSGGFCAGAGASGRKNHADTYGGLLPSGGSSISGRDPWKPQRAGNFMARFAAKSLVAKGVAGNILISAGYTIGQPEPIFLHAQTGKGEDITAIVKEKFDFRPEAIVEQLDLAKPIYHKVSTYGYFGRDGVPWEQIA
ncbi:MAG: methionine adenosyltransferase domain-containing protein [Patescibacteria group bacterium]